jgi:hypothetical protein
MVYGLWFMVYGLWFMVEGLESRVWGSGFRVEKEEFGRLNYRLRVHYT